MSKSLWIAACAWLALACSGLSSASADETDGDRTVKFGDGKLQLVAPADWERKEPANRIVEVELAAPAAEGDEQAARITIMGAGGSIEANIDRWITQFTQPDGSSTRDQTKIEKIKVADTEVHLVDIKGTYKDQAGGPFARQPATMRDGYRMLAAIIVTDYGRYYVKMYGPAKTIAENEKPFRAFIESLAIK